MNKQLHTEYELEVVAREESADGVAALDPFPEGAGRRDRHVSYLPQHGV